MDQAVLAVTRSSLDVIGKNQVKFAKYMGILDYAYTIMWQVMDIEEACVEGEITDVFSWLSAGRIEKRDESFFWSTSYIFELTKSK